MESKSARGVQEHLRSHVGRTSRRYKGKKVRRKMHVDLTGVTHRLDAEMEMHKGTHADIMSKIGMIVGLNQTEGCIAASAGYQRLQAGRSNAQARETLEPCSC